MATKRKFSAGRNYAAKFTLPKFDKEGNFLRKSKVVIDTSFSGVSILKFGLKQVIRHEAKRLQIDVSSYSCVVDEG